MELSWEEMSSFSPNRFHDEELENYSSVTQKKAYFEAHFGTNNDQTSQNDLAQEVEQSITSMNVPDDHGAEEEEEEGEGGEEVPDCGKDYDQVEPTEVHIKQLVEPPVEEKHTLIEEAPMVERLLDSCTTKDDCVASTKKLQKEVEKNTANRQEKQLAHKVTLKELNAKPVQESRRRPTKTVNLSSEMPEVKRNFTLKSDERAERRKQFYLKLEEKLSAREAESKQIQAKTQEEKEALMKQFRRSLNFKATPLPSFYNSEASNHSKIGRKIEAVGKKERRKTKDAMIKSEV